MKSFEITKDSIMESVRSNIHDIVANSLDQQQAEVISKINQKIEKLETNIEMKFHSSRESTDRGYLLQQVQIQNIQCSIQDLLKLINEKVDIQKFNDFQEKVLFEIDQIQQFSLDFTNKEETEELNNQINNIQQDLNKYALQEDVSLSISQTSKMLKENVQGWAASYFVSNEEIRRLKHYIEEQFQQLKEIDKQTMQTQIFAVENYNKSINKIESEIKELLPTARFEELQNYSKGFCHISHLENLSTYCIKKFEDAQKEIEGLGDKCKQFLEIMNKQDYLLLGKASKMDIEDVKKLHFRDQENQINEKKNVTNKIASIQTQLTQCQQNLDETQKSLQFLLGNFDPDSSRKFANQLKIMQKDIYEVKIGQQQKLESSDFMRFSQCNVKNSTVERAIKVGENMNQLAKYICKIVSHTLKIFSSERDEIHKKQETTSLLFEIEDIVQTIENGDYLKENVMVNKKLCNFSTLEVQLKPMPSTTVNKRFGSCQKERLSLGFQLNDNSTELKMNKFKKTQLLQKI